MITVGPDKHMNPKATITQTPLPKTVMIFRIVSSEQ